MSEQQFLKSYLSNLSDQLKPTDETIEKARAEIISPFEPLRPNSIYQYYNRPDWYDEPREIQVGFQLSW